MKTLARTQALPSVYRVHKISMWQMVLLGTQILCPFVTTFTSLSQEVSNIFHHARLAVNTRHKQSVQIAAFLRRLESELGTHLSHELVEPHRHRQVALERQFAGHEGTGRIQLSCEHLDEGVALHDEGHINLALRWVPLANGTLAVLEVDVPPVGLTFDVENEDATNLLDQVIVQVHGDHAEYSFHGFC